MSEGSSTLYLKVPNMDRFVQNKEIFSYQVPDFLGDLGGILGLFLGLSIWGLIAVAGEAFQGVKELWRIKVLKA